MKNYGSNNLLVKEVKELIKKNNMFSNSNGFKDQFDRAGIKVIHDFNQAEIFAWSQDSDEVETVWEYVKSSESEDFVDQIYTQGLDAVHDFFSNIKNYSSDFIPFKFLDITEEVEGDLTMCALNRVINGKTNNFYERLFEIYKSGGWPCGWSGSYPSGKLIAFFPKK